jgi:hypothetical protein
MKKIIFTNISDYKDLEPPKPASRYIPDWYKQSKSYSNNEKKPFDDGSIPSTIKRCIPVFDAITSGYIIESPADIYISPRQVEKEKLNNIDLTQDHSLEKQQHFVWSWFNVIDFHPIDQAPNHPLRNEFPYPKWINPWGIKTPKSYSSLFIQPMHRDSVFTIFPGIVDTDKYENPVNFPFVVNDSNFEGIIPKGTPIAQVIPFKRDTWETVIGDKNNLENILQTRLKMNTKFFDKYKNMFWDKKQYN